MAQLRNETTQLHVHLQQDHLVGRSMRCSLRVDDDRVSKVHASIRWTGEFWMLKDLGSMNGTMVDGRALRANEHVVLRPGARIAFGHGAQTWCFLDDGPPRVMALPHDGGAAVLAIDGLLALPSTDQPALTVHRDEQGQWVADVDGELFGVTDQERVNVCEQTYILCLPHELAGTAPLRPFPGLHVTDLFITFRTSSDLEHIELDVRVDSKVKRFAARTHNEMLLVLARAHVQDAARGVAPVDCGWMYLDDLCRSVALDRERLNIDVYRLRRQFAELGLLDPANIIERRPKTKQLRIGTSHVDELPV